MDTGAFQDLATQNLIYAYPPLYEGILIKRYKRFFADIELTSGEIITAHCPNTGPMTGVSTVGSRVLVSKSNNPKRKLAYTWELISVDGVWVGVNTAMPNRVTKLVLEKYLLPTLGNYQKITPEVAYGEAKDSRIDFLLTGDEGFTPVYLEVKSTTLAQPPLALFPDTETTRGQKHLRELTALLPQYRGVMLYFINRGDCDRFSPGDEFDRLYGQLLREGIAQGLEVLPCRFQITPQGIVYLGLAELGLENLVEN
ncbi:MAG: DNA/RNA nuclease SfsA [Coleofasciculaceae cyanobacterium SM2_1_6]|nr:DNA/RNA nuclease SfsA [Coleofasciculaceae cyanobacterium SM2_1_6]